MDLTQLWNVLLGENELLVGPRPNVKRNRSLYDTGKRHFRIKSITDFASIVFSDEGDILKDYLDPDIFIIN